MKGVYINAIINGVLNLALFWGVVLIRRIVHKEGIASFWLQRSKKGWLLFFEGAAVGMIAFAAYPLLTTILQLGTINFAPQKILDTVLLILTQGFAFVGVALFEEALFRGYLLRRLEFFTSFPILQVPHFGLGCSTLSLLGFCCVKSLLAVIP